MFSGGTATSKSIFFILLIPLMAIAIIILTINFEMFYNIIVYGKMSGPCMWPGDYVSAGGSAADLTHDETDECYKKQTP